jgi:predicted  nucleic acid-binding Zn-ribbon protein
MTHSDPSSAPPTTKQILQQLIRLQKLDEQRDKAERSIQTSQETIKAREKDIEKKRAEQKAAEARLIDARKAAAAVELELKSKAANIAKLELQASTARTNQEYQALLGHVAKLKEEVSREEDAGLANYDRIVECEKVVAAAKAAVAKAEEDHRAYVAVCEKEETESRAELAATEGKRREMLAALPVELSTQYERTRPVREGVAIVALDGRCCGGCGVTVTPNEIQKLINVAAIVTCKSCQRILYSTAGIPYV